MTIAIVCGSHDHAQSRLPDLSVGHDAGLPHTTASLYPALAVKRCLWRSVFAGPGALRFGPKTRIHIVWRASFWFFWPSLVRVLVFVDSLSPETGLLSFSTLGRLFGNPQLRDRSDELDSCESTARHIYPFSTTTRPPGISIRMREIRC